MPVLVVDNYVADLDAIVGRARALSPERAQQALAVKLRGVITCTGSLIFFQDATAGIFIDAPVVVTWLRLSALS